MKINDLKINGFGKLKNKEIHLENQINVIYGKNEAGKSSLLKFISGMFYGASKNKNGKEISDFERFKPWKTEEFSGKMTYTLDNGKMYEVYRDFKKKNPIIYDENNQDISKEFTMDKTKGIDFFVEQTGIDEETFFHTAITEQEGVRLSRSSQNSIVQKISNLISTGDDSISYQKSLEKLTKLQNERIGTERTSQRPINKVNDRLKKLEMRKREIESIRENVQNSIEAKENIENELNIEKSKLEFLKKIKTSLEKNRIRIAEINLNKNLENEYQTKIEELNNKIDDSVEEKVKNKKISKKEYYICLVVFIIACICMFIFNENKIVDSLFLIPIAVIIGLMVFKEIKNKKEIQKRVTELNEIKARIANEIQILKENKESQKTEYSEKYEKLMQKIENEKAELKSEYVRKIDMDYILLNIENDYDEILEEIEARENRIHTLEFKLHTIKSDAENFNEKLEELTEIEENLQDAELEKEELTKLSESFEIAKDCLENAYIEVKQNISPKFTENLSNIIQNISDGRYQKIRLNDVDGLTAEIESGEYLPVSRLSTGTIDQMYLSLRLSALEEITTEKMPIILDEVFAYFDNERLKNILKYIVDNYKASQILLFTCSNREKQVLEELNVEYNLINLEK